MESNTMGESWRGWRGYLCPTNSVAAHGLGGDDVETPTGQHPDVAIVGDGRRLDTATSKMALPVVPVSDSSVVRHEHPQEPEAAVWRYRAVLVPDAPVLGSSEPVSSQLEQSGSSTRRLASS